jgi:uncharacterized protein
MTPSPPLARIVLALLAALLMSVAAADSKDGARLDQIFSRASLQIATPDARLHRFRIWVADDDQRRSLGLMFVKHLEDDQGMLFVYPSAQAISMWMKNTYIPLDMLFVRDDGRIQKVVANTTPLSLETIECKEPVVAVIELKAGVAQKLKIVPGSWVQHENFADQR